MNVHDLAAARAHQPVREQRPHAGSSAAGSGAGFGKVYEIQTARRARGAGGPRIPLELREEVRAADRLYEELRSQDLQVRFHDGIDGRVVARLCELDGTVVRPIALRDLLNLDVGPEPAA